MPLGEIPLHTVVEQLAAYSVQVCSSLKVSNQQECVSPAKQALTLSEEGVGMLTFWGCRLIVCSAPTLQDTVCTLLSRNTTTTTTHLEEREAELELQRLEKKDEPGEAASERWQHFLLEPSSVTSHTKKKSQIFASSMCVNVSVYFAGVGRQSRWTAAAATAQRSQLPAQRACVQRASASPLEGAVIRQPANFPQ